MYPLFTFRTLAADVEQFVRQFADLEKAVALIASRAIAEVEDECTCLERCFRDTRRLHSRAQDILITRHVSLNTPEYESML